MDVNLSGLLSPVPPYSTGTLPALSVHSDSAPVVYLNGNPSQTDTTTRTIERATKHIEAVNPITHETDHVTNMLAGLAAMRNLHMLTGDSSRNPSFTLFADADYFLCATGFQCPDTGSQVVEAPGFAWNHGTVSSDINVSWMGMAGPGVRRLAQDTTIWSDHADDRPTLMAMLGMKDDYRHAGRVLAEIIEPEDLPRGFGDPSRYVPLAQTFTQINAPLGQFGMATLRASTTALESGTPQNDSV